MLEPKPIKKRHCDLSQRSRGSVLRGLLLALSITTGTVICTGIAGSVLGFLPYQAQQVDAGPPALQPEIWLSGPTDGEPIIGPLTCTVETNTFGPGYRIEFGSSNKVLESKAAWTEVLDFTIQTHMFENGPIEFFADLVSPQGQVIATDTFEVVIRNPELSITSSTPAEVDFEIDGLPNDCAYIVLVGSSTTPSYSDEFDAWLPISDTAILTYGLFPNNYDGDPLNLSTALTAPTTGGAFVALLTWSFDRGWSASFARRF